MIGLLSSVGCLYGLDVLLDLEVADYDCVSCRVLVLRHLHHFVGMVWLGYSVVGLDRILVGLDDTPADDGWLVADSLC